jgi:hypothetical protein
VARLVTYGIEYGFNLLKRVNSPRRAVEVRMDDPRQEGLVDHLDKVTLFTDGAEGANFGVGVAWREDNR